MKADMRNEPTQSKYPWFRAVTPSGIAVALALVPVSTGASDSKIFNGTFCRAAPEAGFLANANYAGSEVRNEDTGQWLRVVCPIVRDNTQNTSGWDHITIGWFDRSLPFNIECNAWSRDQSGVAVWTEMETSTFTAQDVWDNVTLENPMSGSVVDGYYHLVCDIPPRDTSVLPGTSGVAFYRVQEP